MECSDWSPLATTSCYSRWLHWALWLAALSSLNSTKPREALGGGSRGALPPPWAPVHAPQPAACSKASSFSRGERERTTSKCLSQSSVRSEPT